MNKLFIDYYIYILGSRFPKAIRTGGGYIIFNEQLREILSEFDPNGESTIPQRLQFVELPERDYKKMLPGRLEYPWYHLIALMTITNNKFDIIYNRIPT